MYRIPCFGRLMKTLVVTCAMLAVSPTAWCQVRVASYNIAQFNGDQNDIQAVLDAISSDDSRGFPSDLGIIVFQEVTNDMVSPIQTMLGSSYSRGTYSNQGESAFAGAQLMFYRADIFVEDVSEHRDIYTAAGRYTDRWKLDLINFDDPAISIYVYSAHLKSGSSTDNKEDRIFGANQIREDAETLPAGSNIIYAGDWNISTSSEETYSIFTDGGNSAQAIDPYGNGSWSGSSNAYKHTQSPRQVAAGGLIGGSMDDRFDFLLPSLNLSNGGGLDIIPGTYRPLGNDGQHYDVAINAGNNFYFSGEVTRSNLLADALHEASDHIPVVLDLQFPASSLLFAIVDNPQVIQGGLATVSAYISNESPVTVPEGAALLQCQVTGSGALLGRTTVTDEALGGFGITSLSFDTSTPGIANGTIAITPLGDDVQGSPMTQSVSTNVLRPAEPSLSADMTSTVRTIDVPVQADSGIHEVHVDVFNRAYDSQQALLDVDSITGMTTPVSLLSSPASQIAASAGTIVFAVDSAMLPSSGTQEVQIVVTTSDEDLPGATATNLTVVLEIRDENSLPCTADFLPPGGDGLVNLFDFSGFLVAFGSSDPTYDIAPSGGDGIVDLQDFSEFLVQYGPCP